MSIIWNKVNCPDINNKSIDRCLYVQSYHPSPRVVGLPILGLKIDKKRDAFILVGYTYFGELCTTTLAVTKELADDH